MSRPWRSTSCLRARISLACIIITTACGGSAERATRLAPPTVRLSRNPVPIGGPFDLTLRFSMPPDAAPFEARYRVRLEFLFEDGNVMWSDDHDPPTPTTEWTPGVAVTYTRRLFVPDLPYVGRLPILVSLSAESGERLRLSGPDEGGKYRVGTLMVQPQSPSSLLIFGDGWHQPENVMVTSPGSRWTDSRASLAFRNPQEDSVLYLRLAGRPGLFAAPQQVSILVGARTVGSFAVTSHMPSDYEVRLSAGDFGADEDVGMTLAVDKTFVPAEQPGHSADRRVLGVLVYHAFLEPVSGPR
jgi:hypothetical protein